MLRCGIAFCSLPCHITAGFLTVGALDCWGFGLLGLWTVGALDCSGFGLLGLWTVGVLDCWGFGLDSIHLSDEVLTAVFLEYASGIEIIGIFT